MGAPVYDHIFLQGLERGLRSVLAEWEVAENAEIRLLAISENATYRVRDGQRDLVLRVSRPGYATEASIQSEIAWLRALEDGGVVRTAAPVPGRRGDCTAQFDHAGATRLVTAFAFLPGCEPDEGEGLVANFIELGGIHAKLHRHAQQWAMPANFSRRRWTFETMLGEQSSWGDWRNAPGMTPEGVTVLERTCDVMKLRLEAFGQAPARFGLIHADLRLANLLTGPEGLFVIDFDDCGFSWFLYDFAAAVSFIEHKPHVADLQAAWLEGYRREMPLSVEDEAELPTFVMLRRCMLTAWIASHAETPTAQSVAPHFAAGTVALARRYLADIEARS